MESQLVQFEKLSSRIAEINNFINLIEVQKKLSHEYYVLEDKKNIILKNMEEYATYALELNNSVVQYNAVIISVYSCFENYVHELSKEFIRFQYKRIENFMEFPKRTKMNYFKVLGDYLSSPNKFSGIEFSPEEVIEKIIKNVSDKKGAEPQFEFIINHSGNLKIDKVAELFANLGISNCTEKITKNYNFKSFIAELNNIEIDEVGRVISNKILTFNNLDKLVDARNSVAHKWSEENRISYNTISEEIIPFILSLSETLLEITIAESYKFLKQKNILSSFDMIYKVINNKIICLNSKKSFLQKGDYIVYENSKNNFYVAKIQKIEIDKLEIEKVIYEDVDIGIELDRPVKEHYIYYYFENINN